MVEEQKSRLEKAFHNLLNSIDKSHLRKMEYDMHMCAAKCCQSTDSSMEQIHKCKKSCSVRIETAQNIVQTEVTNIQTRIERCIMQCQDEVSDEMKPNPSSSDMAKYNQKFESCASRCFDNMLMNIPKLSKKIQQQLQETYQKPAFE